MLRDEREVHRSGEGVAQDPPPDWSDRMPRETLASAVSLADWLMDRDSKSPGLKLLQGAVWRAGYESGQLAGEVFEDVPPALDRWSRAGVRAASCFSGSVLAQRLLLGTTRFGDLVPKIAAFFVQGDGASDGRRLERSRRGSDLADEVSCR